MNCASLDAKYDTRLATSAGLPLRPKAACVASFRENRQKIDLMSLNTRLAVLPVCKGRPVSCPAALRSQQHGYHRTPLGSRTIKLATCGSLCSQEILIPTHGR